MNSDKIVSESKVMQSEQNQQVYYYLNPAVRILSFDTSSRSLMYQVILGERRYQVNEVMAQVLERLRQARTAVQLEEALYRPMTGANGVNDAESRFLDFLLSNRIVLIDQDEKVDGPSGTSLPNPLSVRLPLFPRRWLLPLTSRLQRLYYRNSALVLVAFIIVSHGLFFSIGGFAKPTNFTLSANTAAFMTAVLVMCVFLHELGHLSACERYGAKHGGIGIGFFLIWPVAYAEVRDCWSLPRYQRAVVDIGGIYFHSICSGVFCCLWIMTGDPVYWALVYSIITSTLLNINPFVKFDGYWFLTDITGIPSLHRSARESSEYFMSRISGKRDCSKPEVLAAHPFIVTIFLVYCAGSAVFVVYLMHRVGSYLPKALAQAPEQLARLWHMALMLDFGWSFWKLALGILVVLMTAYTLSLMLWRRIRRFTQGMARLARASQRFWRLGAGNTSNDGD
jgi:putative peptide zinc metalloprotease protein